MNYRLILGGYRFTVFDECIKLLIHSAKESDYITQVVGTQGLSPVSPNIITLYLTGSAKKTYNDIVVDFDNIFKSEVSGISLNPDVLSLDSEPNGSHYWGIMGALCKVISDISPAYVTGYLLEKNLKKELDIFTKFSSQLPFALQVAVNESIKDIID